MRALAFLVPAIRRLASRVAASKISLERRVAAAGELGKGQPPIESCNRAWEPILYFEYTDRYEITTHYSDPYLELVELID